ncbi:MAG TPA: nuclear transport factor 2 family protein [Acidimicrobiales bacterium]|jgi:uncharacterized protein (TIGR02246 family)
MGTVAEIEDREEIRELLARYNHTIDAHQSDEWVGLFTDDGVFDAGGRAMQGPDELRAFADGVPVGLRHVIANEIIELDGDQATVKSYLFILAGKPAAVMTTGVYVDSVRRVDGRWRFARRVFTPDT